MASKILIPLIAILLTSLVAGSLYVFQNYSPSLFGPTPTPVPVYSESVQVSTTPSKSRVKVGSTETVVVNLPTSVSKVPTAYDLSFNYDNRLVEVVNVVPGRIWNSSNVLKKDIDNGQSRARLAAGQGFNGKVTDSRELVEIEYRVLATGEIRFSLDYNSIFAYVDGTEATQVKSSDVVIQAID